MKDKPRISSNIFTYNRYSLPNKILIFFKKLLPFREEVEDLFGGGKGSVCGEEDVDVG